MSCISPKVLLSLYTQKILTGLEHKNGEIKPKSRRRWGLVSRSTKDSDDWADLDDSDFSPSFTRIDLKNKKRQTDETLCRQVCGFSSLWTDLVTHEILRDHISLIIFSLSHILSLRLESTLDLKPSDPVGTGNSAPSQTSYQRRDTPTMSSAAKQHYLKQSRYLPGK